MHTGRRFHEDKDRCGRDGAASQGSPVASGSQKSKEKILQPLRKYLPMEPRLQSREAQCTSAISRQPICLGRKQIQLKDHFFFL